MKTLSRIAGSRRPRAPCGAAPADSGEVDALAYAAWVKDGCPSDGLPLYRRLVEDLLLASRHLSQRKLA
ncbi:MAG: hypothetical protein ABSF76_10440 [Opitutaceae bacterium]